MDGLDDPGYGWTSRSLKFPSQWMFPGPQADLFCRVITLEVSQHGGAARRQKTISQCWLDRRSLD